MGRSSKIMGFVGLGGSGLLLAGVIAAMASFERGVYSPLSCFVTELGQYTGGYLSASSALFFNIGIVLFGLTFGLLMIWRGNRGETGMSAATGFFGALAGVLAAAQGIFTLNYTQYHYIVVSAFYFAAAVFCALQVAEWLRGSRSERFGLALLIFFFAAGALCLAAGVFTATGGFERVLTEDISGAGRLLVVPFALIGWLAVASLWACGILLSLGAVLSPAASAPVQRLAKRQNDFAL
jgi:hypothetical protein